VKVGIVMFPGSNREVDASLAVSSVGGEVVHLWHKDHDLQGSDVIILPGGFSYGDYLRAGAIARFSPVMAAVTRHARDGRPVLGVCNGFQILCEAGLLPGALMRNARLQFLSRPVRVRVERTDTPFTGLYRPGEVVEWPIAHGEGRYVADPSTLAELAAGGQVVLRYADDNPNGSIDNIAGVCNAGRNVVGIMPHPERRTGALVGGADGARVFLSMEARNATPHAAGDVRAVGGRHLRV
jgi:phosphoribosylformylglycinamidine synthase